MAAEGVKGRQPDPLQFGGYDNDFVDPVSPKLECPVCLLPFFNPYLLDCCGIKICGPCVQMVQNQEKPCPLCKQDFNSLIDKATHREVLDLKVFCSNRTSGCDWKGELRYLEKHVNKECGWVEVECSYGCGGRYPRHKLKNHEQDECLERPLEVSLTSMDRKMSARIEALEEKQMKQEELVNALESRLVEKEEEITKLRLMIEEKQTKDGDLLQEMEAKLLQNGEDIVAMKAKIKELEMKNVEKKKTGAKRKQSKSFHEESEESVNEFKVHSGGFEAGKCSRFTTKGYLIPGESKRGINVVVLDSYGNLSYRESFDTHKQVKESSRFCEFINGLQGGTVIGIAVKDDAKECLTEPAVNTIKYLGGTEIFHVKFRSSYALVAIVGYPSYTLEAATDGDIPAIVSYLLPASGIINILNGQSFVVKVISAGYLENGGMGEIQAVHSGSSFMVTCCPLQTVCVCNNICVGDIDPRHRSLRLKLYDVCDTKKDSDTLEAEFTQGSSIYGFAKTNRIKKEFRDSFHDMMEALGSKFHKEVEHSSSWVFIGSSSNNTPVAEVMDHKAKIAIAATFPIPF